MPEKVLQPVSLLDVDFAVLVGYCGPKQLGPIPEGYVDLAVPPESGRGWTGFVVTRDEANGIVSVFALRDFYRQGCSFFIFLNDHIS